MAETIKVAFTNSDVVYTILVDLTEQSVTMSNLLKEVTEGIDTITLPSEEVSPDLFPKIVDFMTEKDKNPPPKPPTAEEDPAMQLEDPNHVLDKPYQMTDYDTNFTKDMSMADLMIMLKSANYLDSKHLVQVCCRATALQVLGKTPKEIYAMFGVDKELTPEEEEEVIKENPWLADK